MTPSPLPTPTTRQGMDSEIISDEYYFKFFTASRFAGCLISSALLYAGTTAVYKCWDEELIYLTIVLSVLTANVPICLDNIAFLLHNHIRPPSNDDFSLSLEDFEEKLRHLTKRTKLVGNEEIQFTFRHKNTLTRTIYKNSEIFTASKRE